MEQVILDVREQDEFAAAHVQGSVCVPLSRFAQAAPGVLQSMLGKKILIMCRSGKRAGLALEQISQLGFGGQVSAEVYQGGILEWARQGKPVVSRKAEPLSLARQVRLTAGLGVLASAVLGFGLDQRAFFAAALIGADLALAGLTGSCQLEKLLAALPWNKQHPGRDCSCG
ncbi:MAG: hypothetical protein A2X35_07415 [Elusimicrobia bacterium GWA2_61_42]|nr:MAG: hypothetical protein A2X35_07415 [Elusimicrobia bacterium GWA2_61_42]OGR75041.1 MAG: hypothetical protein A2X38_01565 [Elusimicrobia bacterium GWC2_61_25]